MNAHEQAASHVIFGWDPIRVSSILFFLTYAAIVSERINRAMAALVGAGLMISLGVPDQETAIRGVEKSPSAERRVSEQMLGVDHDPFGVDQNYPVNRSLMRVPRLLDQREIQRQLMVGRKKRREGDLSPVTANRSMCVTKEDMTQVMVPVDGRDEVVDIHQPDSVEIGNADPKRRVMHE